jgi:lambda family phage portal protein
MTPTALDRMLLQVAPRFAVNRMKWRAAGRVIARHYEAAQPGRRTDNWKRVATDANSANGAAIHTLRNLARDLVRNNAWARKGKRVIANHTVGWGIVPKPIEAGPRALKRSRELWRQWAGSKSCDFEGQRNFYGLQRQVMHTIVESGEVLVRRYRVSPSKGLAIPLQLQVLEPDHLDTTRDGVRLPGGGRIVQGVEFDAQGRRVAYWLFPEHPGASFQLSGITRLTSTSQRVSADDIAHVYRIDRIGQVRGVSWYAPAIVKLKDYDEYDDATLLRQKIAACFAAFVTDVDGNAPAVGEPSAEDPLVETLDPGMVVKLPIGKSVTFADPPTVADGNFDERQLRAVAAGLGTTYEDLTGDYSGMNFSSARMSRLSHWEDIHENRWDMLIPRFCDTVWEWAMDTALIAGLIGETPGAEWTPPRMPIIDPEKEGLAFMRMVRTGAMTFDEMVREMGGDPELHWQEYAEQQQRLDALKIVLDSDARRTTQAGNPAAAMGGGSSEESAGKRGKIEE